MGRAATDAMLKGHPAYNLDQQQFALVDTDIANTSGKHMRWCLGLSYVKSDVGSEKELDIGPRSKLAFWNDCKYTAKIMKHYWYL